MNYLKTTITTTHEAADLLADSIAPICGACVVDDPKTVDELIASPSPRWDYIGEEVFENADRDVTVSFFCDNTEDGKKDLEKVEAILLRLRDEGNTAFYGTLETKTAVVEDENWQNNWKQYFKPFPVGERLIVRPSWEAAVPGDRTELVIDPASSFGTGSHATTKMCLEHFQSMDFSGKKVLDAGCGSGILACCTLLFGADSVVACDIEENAMTATAENMALNSIDRSRCKTVLGDLLSDPAVRQEIAAGSPYDVIVANIVADVLMAMKPYLKSFLAENGRIILSGIIDTRADEVLASYLAAGFVKTREKRDAGWVMYEFKL